MMESCTVTFVAVCVALMTSSSLQQPDTLPTKMSCVFPVPLMLSESAPAPVPLRIATC